MHQDAAPQDEVAWIMGDDGTIVLEPVDLAELDEMLARDPAGSQPGSELVRLLFRTSSRLVVYGTLARGESNHHVIAPLRGDWHRGLVRGTYYASGSGAASGYPGIVIDSTAAPVAVDLLVADGLTEAWSDIDRFEGPGYRRRLTAVLGQSGELIAVANIYELAPDAVPGDPGPLVRSNP